MNSLFRLLFIFSLFHFNLCHAAIFGNDDRFSMHSGSPNYNLGQATAVGVLSSLIESSSGDDLNTFEIFPDSLTDVMCKTEKFHNMPSLAYACSGFLIAPDILVTAGHCMVNKGVTENEEGMYCEVYTWLFGYEVDQKGQVNLAKIPYENQYRCKKIIYAVLDEKSPYRDYALVQLDRPVVGREPLKMSAQALKLNDPVKMIGYPMGIPMTYSGNAQVVLNKEAESTFFTDLDAFDGNSGSAVFNTKNEVVGILVAGSPMTSFVSTGSGTNACHVYNKCDQQGLYCTENDTQSKTSSASRAERAVSEVQKIEPLLELVKKHQEKNKKI